MFCINCKYLGDNWLIIFLHFVVVYLINKKFFVFCCILYVCDFSSLNEEFLKRNNCVGLRVHSFDREPKLLFFYIWPTFINIYHLESVRVGKF